MREGSLVRIAAAISTVALLLTATAARSQGWCDVLPAPFPCGDIGLSGLEGTACPKGDIPYRPGACDLSETNWLTLLGSVDMQYAYEYVDPPSALCPLLLDQWGPSSSGTVYGGPGCYAPPEANNCNLGIGGLYASKWCYVFTHITSKEGSGECGNHPDWITHGNVDLVGNDGVCDASDISGFASLLGTRCGYYLGSGPKYNPIADFNKDEYINGTDLSLLAAHVGHHCGQWSSTGPQKLTQLAEHPWFVFDLPEMQAAMITAGIDRDFVVRIWEQNGPEQQLFARGERYDEEAHLVSVAGRQTSAPTAVEARHWGKVKVLYR